MIVSVYRAFAGPIRAEVIGAFLRGHFTRVRVKSICNSRAYPKGYAFDVAFHDVYLNHRPIRSKIEYLGRPWLEDLPVINPEEETP